MVQKIKQGNIFGRIGSGIGKGLADQLPKEIERTRLAKGLEEVAQNSSGKTPFENFAALNSVYGITPQAIQSGSELLKQQGIRSSFANRRSRAEPLQQGQTQQTLNDVNFANMQPRQGMPAQEETRPQPGSAPYVPSQEPGQPQIVEKNPLRKEALPVAPWTQERRDDDISKELEQNPQLTLPEAVARSADNEMRDLAQPAAQREIDAYLKEQQKEVDDEFTKQLELKLQKSKEGVFTDLTGENINNLKRGVARELRTNPNATVKDVVNKWTNRALDLAKTKKDLAILQSRDLWDKLTKQEQTLGKLKSYQKIFHEAGNDDEFFNALRSPETGFNLSPQGAAYLTYPRSKGISQYIDSIKPSRGMQPAANAIGNSRKYATEIEDKITGGDSFLAIARELREKDPFFNQKAFFDQLREDQDSLPLNPRQKRELGLGESDILPNWGDLSILPTFRGF